MTQMPLFDSSIMQLSILKVVSWSKTATGAPCSMCLEERVVEKGTCHPLKDISQKLIPPLPLTPHWSEFGHMATASCKRSWELKSIFWEAICPGKMWEDGKNKTLGNSQQALP